MKTLFAFAAALLGAATLTAATPRDWSTLATPAPRGSFVIGNPAARVKLVEYASYTCSHCAHFAAESAPVLKAQMIRSGTTSIEVRNLVRDKLDLVAVLAARCAGPTRFVRLHEALFAAQDDWLQRGVAYDGANGARMQLYPQAAQLRALADGSGIADLARAAGMTTAAIDACYADPAGPARALRVSAATPSAIRGTPSFEINGKLVEGGTWVQIQPLLRTAGAK